MWNNRRIKYRQFDISKCILKEANKLMKSEYLLEHGSDKQNNIIKSRPHNNQSSLQQ